MSGIDKPIIKEEINNSNIVHPPPGFGAQTNPVVNVKLEKNIPIGEEEGEEELDELSLWQKKQEEMRNPRKYLTSKNKYQFDFSNFPRMRRSHWDLTPEEVERLNVKTYYHDLLNLDDFQGDGQDHHRKRRMQQMQFSQLQKTQEEKEAFVRAQALRIYIGNIPSTLTEEDLVTFFNAQMITKGLIDTKLQKEYADRRKKKRKKKRKKYSMNEDEQDDESSEEEEYSQGQHDDEFSLLTEGGPVTGCKVNYQKSFAFLDFRSEQEATNCLELQGLKLQGTILKIRRPTDYRSKDPQEEKQRQRQKELGKFARSGPYKVSELLEMYETMGDKDKEIAKILDPSVRVESSIVSLRKVANSNLSIRPSAVLVLLNCINVEEFVKDIDYQDLKKDFMREVGKYGNVKSLVIPRPHRDGFKNGFNKVFVQYENLEESKKAASVLGGKKFQGRTVIVMYFNEEKFLRKEYD